jgi:multidrug resistance efflux pump
MGDLIVKVFKWLRMIDIRLLVLTVVVLTGCGQEASSADMEQPAQGSASQQAETVVQQAAATVSGKTVAADGQLASAYPSLGLAFEGGVSGRVLTVAVRPGDELQAGDLLALLDESDLQRAVDDAQLALERASADRERAQPQWERDVASAEHNLASAERAVEGAQLALDRAVADQERAQQQWERDVADAELALAEAERALTSAQLQYTDTPLEQARTSLEQAQKAEKDAEQQYQDMLAWYPWEASLTDPYHEYWQNAIRNREFAEMQLADAQNAYSAQYLGLESSETSVTRAEQTLAVLQQGLAPGYERAIEDAERALVSAQSDVTQAELALAALQEGIAPGYARAVEDAERALALAQRNLGYARLVAPWPAIALAVHVAPGATTAPGTPVVTLLNVQDGLLFVTYDLGEQHVADVHVGQRAVVTLRAFADQPLEGTVEAVIPLEGGDAASAHFGVRVRLEPTDPSSDSGQSLRLMPGLTGRVEIFAGE